MEEDTESSSSAEEAELDRSPLMESELRSASASISWSRARDDSTWRNSSSSRVIATSTAPLLAAEDDERRRGLPTTAGDGGANRRRSSTARRNRAASVRFPPPSYSIGSSAPLHAKGESHTPIASPPAPPPPAPRPIRPWLASLVDSSPPPPPLP